MARLIDDMKIERIKDATLEMVVANGYGGASISKIAKNAGVAEGYLYRFYSSKNELVNDLLFTNVDELANKIERLLDELHSVWEIFEHLIRSLINLSQQQPDRIKFLFVLMHDYNFNLIESQRERIFELCKRIKEIGLEKNQLRKDVTEEEIYLMGVAYPIQFINLRLKSFFNNTQLTDKEVDEVLTLCINSLKQ
ncbi:MAG: TetR/AcrR family transcriptional regulator [Bacteroidetes bacterium]|nr:TetR/AcrR family transcriptional regulator [Bacteroidota bacterium]